ncbi:hypothetical protein [Croceimicrobium hydrocarbonivorans]|uniref:Uncharacterized protein n=1 Tax=Croceimicrobium hydrocarbonivorans TaxID=2761580 RepID=A0A7H0VBB4_9FLAO|nr:hypothetical protein [Croceimicrobium hydrocarbonivorans]QNR23012.1 hypothetical protein H4K34_11540 [Croceimicrobium hydrocarbonivorans]
MARTRNADVVSSSAIGALLEDLEGNFYLEATVFDDTVSNVIELSQSGAESTNAIRIDINGTGIEGTCVGSGGTTSISGAPAVAGTYNKVCFNYGASGMSLHVDGSTEGSASNGGLPSTLNQWRFTDGTNPFRGRIRVCAYNPNKLNATESNNLTT